ncbi:hypothetical protein [Fodinicola acaciae]|uniref:hypothetical protein n=1 Tax=Fodinicola acaciae TaxID=2681555 RepID=UPI0013CF5764|nr:hypothetical protein [Fodinicola acaciae]
MGRRTSETGGAQLSREAYERELDRLRNKLMALRGWIRYEPARLVIVFEARDGAGKGSAIKRLTEYLNPRVVRTVALPAPTSPERTQRYFQRYVDHLPTEPQTYVRDAAAGG